ncbi:MAG TPA: Hsp70 family protein [Oscillatoriaceae cyanobacterium M33_DOE_052]|uniref:Hsp70 family protein n=1 Tax=Planktothricoides sp. SpSt-374 TaxID=2282167 RepID=A0A7C3ZJJ0_9CYAN|nr:Hsp70 family protein [Oscillatoriaceae cyanobacterium M33_DOE_052]
MPAYSIGLDFGTTNSIISYLSPRGEPEAFQYGGPDGQKYIPSFIAYEDAFIEIGTAARTTAAHNPAVESYGNFKMQLPIFPGISRTSSPLQRTPPSITADYLRELLISADNPYSFCNQQGEIAGVVVSVPEIWQRDIYNRGRECLQGVIRELGLPLMQLVSEPVAAAAYYAWEMQRRALANQEEPFTGNLLVCDVGGGTFDVSLCRIYRDNKVEVLYFDGQGAMGLDCAGVAFDRRCVQLAYTQKHGHPIAETDPEFSRLLREFETVKIGSHPRVTKKLINCLKAPDIYENQEIYLFAGGYSVTFGQVQAAFASIAPGIQQVMQGVKSWLQQGAGTNREPTQLDRLFLVGGFSQFLLVQRTIFDSLEISSDDPRFDRSFNLTNSAYAISYGACLIANGLVDPTERYIHTLGILVDTINSSASLAQKFITLVQGNTPLLDLLEPHFAQIPPLVPFPSNTIGDEHFLTITIWVDPQSRGIRFQESLPDLVRLPVGSDTRRWRVGMRVDRSQIAYLVIADTQGEKRLEYELGQITAKLFQGQLLD